MAGERSTQNPFGGFGAAPSFGFAAAGREGNRSLGSYAPQVGFATAMKAAEQQARQTQQAVEAETKKAERKAQPARKRTAAEASERAAKSPTLKRSAEPKPSEQLADRDLRDDEFRRLTDDGLVIGRRVQVRGSGWKQFERELQDMSGAYRTVPYNKLTMPYLNEAETDGFVNQVLQKAPRHRLWTPAGERSVIRGFREQLAAQLGSLVRLDLDNETLACEHNPETARRLLEQVAHPDEFALASQHYERPTDNFGIFSRASFLYRGLGSVGVHTKTIQLEDYTGVLTTGRDRIVDMIGDRFGLNTSHISEEWSGPEVPIWRMVGHNTLAGFQYNLPEMPFYDITLGDASVYERSTVAHRVSARA